MSRPLLLCALLLLPAGASGATRRRVAVAARAAALDKQAFDQTYELVFLQAGQSFLKDEAMPDPQALDQFIAALKESERAAAAAKTDRLRELIGNAECVQSGPGTIPVDAYTPMIANVAQALRVGEIVEQNFAPNSRAGASLDATEKKLATACQAEARNQAYDRRGYYQFCLGRKSAEAVYLDPARLARQVSGDPSPACGRVLSAVAADKSRFAPAISQDLSLKMDDIRARLSNGASAGELASGGRGAPPPAGGAATAGPVANSSGYGSGNTVANSAARFSPSAGERGRSDFTQAKGLKVSEPPLNQADLQAGAKLAQIAKRDEIGFTGYCYSYVKSALQKAGVVKRSAIDAAGAAAHAKLFPGFVEKNRGLLGRDLIAIPNPAWPLPIGAVVAWDAGACGYSAKSGHIEIITRINPPQACSDGCGAFQVACLNELGSAPARAGKVVPKAEQDFQAAQAAYDAGATPSAKKAAKIDLNKKKAALAAIKRRSTTPQVHAYVIAKPG